MIYKFPLNFNNGSQLIILLVILNSIFVSCNKTAPEIVIQNKNISFDFFKFYKSNNPTLPYDISCEIVDDTIFAYTVTGTDLRNLQASFSAAENTVLVNKIPQISGENRLDYSQNRQFSIEAKNGTSRNYTVKFKDSNLPTLYINTTKPIQSKTVYMPGKLIIHEKLNTLPEFSGDIEIRGRGNSSWDFPKKPYKIKLVTKAKLLGMNEDRDWILLANYADKTLLRNELGFALSRLIGMPYTPDSRFVEVVINNEYAGNYLLTEQIEVGTKKVNVQEQKVSEKDINITGGYLLEIDGWANRENSYFYTNLGMPISISYPDDKDITQQQKSYITNHINTFEKSLFSENFDDEPNGYKKYFDINSYINFYLLNEIMGNPDLFWSTFLFKNKNSDLIFTGPVWDFDIAANNDNRLGDSKNMLMLNSAHEPKKWIKQLMKDKQFRLAVRKRWNEIYINEIKKIDPIIEQTVSKLKYSQKTNFVKWPILNEKIYLNVQVLGTYNEEVNYLKSFFTSRTLWLNTQFNGQAFD